MRCRYLCHQPGTCLICFYVGSSTVITAHTCIAPYVFFSRAPEAAAISLRNEILSFFRVMLLGAFPVRAAPRYLIPMTSNLNTHLNESYLMLRLHTHILDDERRCGC